MLVNWKLFLLIEKIKWLVDNETVKNPKLNTMKTKANNLEEKIPDAPTLIHINQYNTNKPNLENKMEMLIKKCQIQVPTTVLIQK